LLIAVALAAWGTGADRPTTTSAAAPVPPRPSPGCAATTIETGRRLERTIEIDGTRRYILDVPEGARPQEPVPLLFDFHGFGHSGGGVWNVSRFKDMATREPFITVYPDGSTVHLLGRDGAGWDVFTTDDNRDLRFVSGLLDQLERTYCIDLARVYATGFSNGAFLSYRLACTQANRFAAVAPVGGGEVSLPCAPPRAVPVLIYHARNDEMVAVERARAARDAWVTRNQCREPAEKRGRNSFSVADDSGEKRVASAFSGGGGLAPTPAVSRCERYTGCRDGADVEYCEGDFGHHWPVEATERIWAFFRAHPMSQTVPSPVSTPANGGWAGRGPDRR